MSTERSNYALPLFALIDRAKVDLASPQLPELGEHLVGFLGGRFALDVLDGRIEILGEEPYLVLNGVAAASLPGLFALADVQRTQLYRYRRDSEQAATLVPVAIDPSGGA